MPGKIWNAPHGISIHALREEGDQPAKVSAFAGLFYFYPRPPRGGRPPRHTANRLLSAISIHALREEGDRYCAVLAEAINRISIHALREEGDSYSCQCQTA